MQAIETKRVAVGWYRTQLAEKLQVSQQAVEKWEKGISYPTADKLPVLASVLGCSIDELFLVKGKETA